MTTDIYQAAVTIRLDLLDACRQFDKTTGWITLQPSAGGPPVFTTGDSLYNGSLGVAVFLAALDAHRGTSRDIDTVRAVARPLLNRSAEQFLEADRFGMAGIGGTVYGLELLTRYTDDNRFRDRAVAVIEAATGDDGRLAATGSATGTDPMDSGAEHASDESTPAEAHSTDLVDFVHGVAGLLAAALALPEGSVAPSLLTGLGDTLVSRQRTDGTHAGGWPGTESVPTVGLAHGVHGVALSLGRLYDRTGYERYHRAVTDALSFSRTARVEEGWTTGPGTDQTEVRSGWCWGSAGIGLALHDLAQTTGLVRQDAIKHAIKTTDGVEIDSDCLCHGTASTLALLVREDNETDQTAAVRFAHNHLLSDGSEYDLRHDRHGAVLRPSLMRGRAGIGYQLLRSIDPTTIHPITLFE
jgi:lantibiotic modifying enzyme